MSGAFNIDFEAEEKDGKIHLFCASLTDSWEVYITKQKLTEFATTILKDDETKQVAPPIPNVDSIADVETYLCSLGCSSKILRSAKFHDALEIPKSVREGLQYASDKAFGKVLASSFLQKYISFLEKKDGKKRFIRVTQEDKGGSITLYSDEKSQQVIGSMKLVNKVVVATTPLERSFVLKAGKRQWLFQAFDNNAFNSILSAIITIMKQFPDAKLPELTTIQASSTTTTTTTTTTTSNAVSPTSNNNNVSNNSNNAPSIVNNTTIIITKQATEADLPKLQEENQKLNQHLERLQEQNSAAEYEYQQLLRLKISLSQGSEEMKRTIEKEFFSEREEFVKDYVQQNQDLKDVIADLERQLTAKAAISDPPIKFGFKLKKDKNQKKKKQVVNDDSEEEEEKKTEEKAKTEQERQIEFDLEKKYLQTLTDEEKYQIKFEHAHLHKHEHKHIHHHKHTHIDNENRQNFKDIRYNEDKHTITHIITPTNTQYKINSILPF